MEKIPRLDGEQRDNLVAYLDGELPERESQEIEQVLARSEVARHDVDVLSRAYDALDLLPSVRASGEFTHKTVTALRIAAAPRVAAPKLRWTPAASRWTILCGWGVALVLVTYCGFLVTNRWIPNEADRLLREFPIVEKLDAFLDAGEIDFLRELQKRGEFHEAASAGAWAGSLASIPERRRRIAAMPESERTRLVGNVQRFQRLPDLKREQLFKLEGALEGEKDPQEENLRQIIDDYHTWLATLSVEHSTELERIEDPVNRARRVSELRKHQQTDFLTESDGNGVGAPLSSVDLAAVMEVLEKALQPRLENEELGRLDMERGPRRYLHILHILTLSHPRNADQKRQAGWERHPLRTLDDILAAISDKSQSDQLRAFPPEGRRMQLMQLLRRSVLAEYERLKPDEETLVFFFDGLGSADRDRVMSHPPQRLAEELTRLYMEKHQEIFPPPGMLEALTRNRPPDSGTGQNAGPQRKANFPFGRQRLPQDREAPDPPAVPENRGDTRRGDEPPTGRRGEL